MSCSGVCIIDSAGAVLHVEGIRTKKGYDSTEYILDAVTRARVAYLRLEDLVKQYQVTELIFEGLSLQSKGRSTRSVAIFLGALLSDLGYKSPYTGISHVSPATLKVFATGNRSADKPKMLEAIEPANPKLFQQLNETPEAAGKYDIADAYWLAQYLKGKV